MLILACALCAMTLTAGAQNHERPIKPEVNSNGDVAFVIHAPRADTVRLKIESQLDTLMQRGNDGVWHIVIPGLQPDVYRYNFIVDGVKTIDPLNLHLMRDEGDVKNMLIVDPQGDLPTAVHDVPHGSVNMVWYDSPTLKAKRRMAVYTPPHYEEGHTRYPVLYLLHGSGGDETAWLVLGRAAQVLDNLIASGKATPMIVVMPNGNVDEDAAPGETAAGLVTSTDQFEHKMDGEFERSFNDIVKWVDSHYRTRDTKRNRAIAGLSMGGYNSLYISLNQPDDFGYIGLMSAVVERRDNGKSPIYDDLQGKLEAQSKLHPRLFWIAIGENDFLYKDNVMLREMMDSNRLKYTYHESDGGHSWRNWRHYLAIFVPMLFK